MREITYCLSCKKDTRNIDPRIAKTKNDKGVMSSKCSFAIIKSLHLLHKDLFCSMV